jgi:hypothetical protein
VAYSDDDLALHLWDDDEPEPAPRRGSSGTGVLMDVAVSATASRSYTSVLAHGADEADRVRLDRLLARIPAHLADPVRRHVLHGERQSAIARTWACSQPTISNRIDQATALLARVARELPDLTPPEVRAVLEGEGLPEHLVACAEVYWTEHTTAAVARVLGISQTIAWERIFGKRGRNRKCGVVDRLSGSTGDAARVRAGLLTLQGWRGGPSWGLRLRRADAR